MSQATTSPPTASSMQTLAKSGLFGYLRDGRRVFWYSVEHHDGVSFAVSEFGSTLLTLRTPSRNGRLDSIVLGYSTLDEYIRDNAYIGATVGRFTNRIRAAQFPLENRQIQLTANEGNNHHHGGAVGFSKRLWRGEVIERGNRHAIRMLLDSGDGDEGYPGNLSASVTFFMPDEERLLVEFEATTDKPTPVSMTLHPYFNLSGHAGDVLNHRLQLFAENFLEVQLDGLPTGQLLPVHSTPMDFRRCHAVGERINLPHEQLVRVSGYDHCYTFDKATEDELTRMAFVREVESGRWLEVYSNAPGLQFYSGNFLGDSGVSAMFRPHAGLCLEPQAWTDAPNHPDFPDTILHPGQSYHHRIEYRFGAEG